MMMTMMAGDDRVRLLNIVGRGKVSENKLKNASAECVHDCNAHSVGGSERIEIGKRKTFDVGHAWNIGRHQMKSEYGRVRQRQQKHIPLWPIPVNRPGRVGCKKENCTERGAVCVCVKISGGGNFQKIAGFSWIVSTKEIYRSIKRASNIPPPTTTRATVCLYAVMVVEATEGNGQVWNWQVSGTAGKELWLLGTRAHQQYITLRWYCQKVSRPNVTFEWQMWANSILPELPERTCPNNAEWGITPTDIDDHNIVVYGNQSHFGQWMCKAQSTSRHEVDLKSEKVNTQDNFVSSFPMK